jgi:hypothetical protein
MISQFVICVVLVVSAAMLFSLLRKWRELHGFHREISIHKDSSVPPEGHFRGPTFGRLASDFFGEMRRFTSPELATRIDVRRQMEPLAIGLRMFSASARAVSGLLILGALLLTLFNLQNAVANLSGTFRDIAQSPVNQTTGTNQQQPLDSVSRIQVSMSSVADVASEAFRLSSVSIGCALLLLAASWLSQRHANQAMSDFTALGIRVHNTLLLPAEGADAATPEWDPRKATEALGNAVVAFEGVSRDLGELATFRVQLQESTNAIKEAVEKLPTSINKSMGEVSTSVAKQIGDNLTQHYDVLMRILAIYGDQQKSMADLKAFAAEVSKQSKASTESLAALKGLGPSVDILSKAVSDFGGDTSVLTRTVMTLDEKVAKLPVMQIGDSVRQLKESGEELSRLLSESRNIQGDLSGFLGSWRAALSAEHKAVVGDVSASLTQVSNRLEALKGLADVSKSVNGLHPAVAEVKSALSTAAGSINTLLALSPSRDQVAEISSRLERLDEEFHKSWWERMRGK